MRAPRTVDVFTFALGLCVLACIVLGLAACGDDESTTTVTETVSSETDATEATEATTTTNLPTQTTDELPPTGPATIGPNFFSSPLKNIGCNLSSKFVRCDIRKKTWKPTPPSEPCELDYGNAVQLGPGGASFICAGDTTLGAPDILQYGERAQRGNLFCDSTEAGITCSNLLNGAGFFLSRENFRIF